MLHTHTHYKLLLRFHVEVSWVVTLCGVVVGYQRFGGPCCLHLQRGPPRCWYPTTTPHVVRT